MLLHPPADKVRQFSPTECREIGQIASALWFRMSLIKAHPSRTLLNRYVDFASLKAFADKPRPSDKLDIFIPYKRFVHAVRLEVQLTAAGREYLILPLKIWRGGTIGERMRLDLDHAERLQAIAKKQLRFRFDVRVTA